MSRSSSITRYAEALDWLFPRTTQIKFGLETTRTLLRELGEPQQHFPMIHVGGTNGKGSVTAMLSAALEEAGFRVGLYTSPHLVSFRERIRVNGQVISEAAVLAWTRHLQGVAESTGATFFELATAIALADFAARKVDIAVIEVGLGGRLDSTNVLTPLVAAITHIALDHQKYLGDTIEQIAWEKAGIAKPGVPFVIGEPEPHRASLLFRAGAQVAGADYRPLLLDPSLSWNGPLGLMGAHQRRNAAVAELILETLPPPFNRAVTNSPHAFATVRVPGRLDRRGKWLYDVAHNPDGVAALAAALRETPPAGPIHALVSILGDKDWPEMLVGLDQVIDLGVLTVAPSADTRRWDLAWLRRWLADPTRPSAQAHWRLIPDFREALEEVERGAGTVLVTGSFHTVGDVMQARHESIE